MDIADNSTASTPKTTAAQAPASAAPEAPAKQPTAQAAAKSPVVKVVTGKATAKKAAVKKVAVKKAAMGKTPVKKATVKKAAPRKTSAKAPVSKTMVPTKPQPAVKQKKPKLVRDSFTIPKAEYLVLDELKQRSTKLTRPAKKSELLRAGIKILATLSDAALLTALAQVPTIKTGRPASKK